VGRGGQEAERTNSRTAAAVNITDTKREGKRARSARTLTPVARSSPNCRVGDPSAPYTDGDCYQRPGPYGVKMHPCAAIESRSSRVNARRVWVYGSRREVSERKPRSPSPGEASIFIVLVCCTALLIR